MQGIFSLLFLFLDQKQLLRIILVPSFLFQNNRASWHLKILVMYQIEQTQIFHARWPLTSDLRILFSQEFESCRTSRFWVNTNQADAASHITTDGTPLKFVSTSRESDICWQVDIVLAGKECCLLHPKSGCSFKNLSRLIAGGFSHCLLPLLSFSSLIQLWHGWISYPTDQKRKNTPKKFSYTC